MNIFEKILLNYGGYILICVRDVFQKMEEYEKCAEINKVLKKHDVSISMTIEDWEAEMWRRGTSGLVAIINAPYYFARAIQMCNEQGLFNKYNK